MIVPNAPGTDTLYGNTWVRNTSIVAASNGYRFIEESMAGKLFVASAFGTAASNISSTTDFNTFDEVNAFGAVGAAEIAAVKARSGLGLQ